MQHWEELPAKRLSVCERWPRGAFVRIQHPHQTAVLFILDCLDRSDDSLQTILNIFITYTFWKLKKKKCCGIPLNNLGVVSHVAYSIFSWWKKMPLWVITTGWHQKCFSFSFRLISKKQERVNEVFVVKRKSQKKSLIIWNSDIQTFKYSFAFTSSQGSLLTINTGQRGIGPTKAHFYLLSMWSDSGSDGLWGILQETLLWEIYPLKNCLFFPKNVWFVLEAIVSQCMDNPHWEENLCIVGLICCPLC